MKSIKLDGCDWQCAWRQDIYYVKYNFSSLGIIVNVPFFYWLNEVA